MEGDKFFLGLSESSIIELSLVEHLISHLVLY